MSIFSRTRMHDCCLYVSSALVTVYWRLMYSWHLPTPKGWRVSSQFLFLYNIRMWERTCCFYCFFHLVPGYLYTHGWIWSDSSLSLSLSFSFFLSFLFVCLLLFFCSHVFFPLFPQAQRLSNMLLFLCDMKTWKRSYWFYCSFQLVPGHVWMDVSFLFLFADMHSFFIYILLHWFSSWVSNILFCSKGLNKYLVAVVCQVHWILSADIFLLE